MEQEPNQDTPPADDSEQAASASDSGDGKPEESSGPENGETSKDASAQGEAGFEISLQDKYDELHDQHLRLAADFENFRKRVAQERESLLKYGAENTIHGLLPILDNLERAANSLNEDSDPKMLYQSFDLLSKQLLDALASQGLKKIETQGAEFDPNFHEATGQVETTEQAENTIVQEMQSGFQLHDRVIRPAMVTVAIAPSSGEDSPADDDQGNPFAQATETES